MARIRTVFNSHSQLCHVWANQSAPHGRAGNMFFGEKRIYSYGDHFLAAKLQVSKNGTLYALINSHRYSVSTAKHLSEISNACRGLMPSFRVPNPETPRAKENLKYLDDQVKALIADSFKSIKVSSTDQITWRLENLKDLEQTANQFRRYLGYKTKNLVSLEVRDEIRAHYKKRFERFRELNTPEVIAEREAKKRAVLEKKLSAAIDQFRKGGPIMSSLSSLPNEMLRIRQNHIETSRGASVPFLQARQIFRRFQNKDLSVIGEKIGGFAINGVDWKTGVVTIGCHRILLSEAEKLMQATPHLQIVSA